MTEALPSLEALNEQLDRELADLEDANGYIAEEPDWIPLQPGADTKGEDLAARKVEYSCRGPRDVVLSGPVLAGWGPGRYFNSRRAAYTWARAKYGPDRVQRVRYTRGRWAFLIKNLKVT
jgi:hypothetical protein